MKMVDYQLIGNRIKRQRQNAGLTQEQLAERAEITTVYLSKIENGHVKPTLELLSTLCEFLDMDMGLLFQNVQPAFPNYQNELVMQYFNACSPAVKPIALELLRGLSEIKQDT